MKMQGNSFQRKLVIVKHGVLPLLDKPKRRTPVSHGGRSNVPNKSQRFRSISFSPDRVRVRGSSPTFHALSANFENAPLVVRKVYPMFVSPDSAKLASKSAAVATLTTSFEQPPSYYASVCQREPKIDTRVKLQREVYEQQNRIPNHTGGCEKKMKLKMWKLSQFIHMNALKLTGQILQLKLM